MFVVCVPIFIAMTFREPDLSDTLTLTEHCALVSFLYYGLKNYYLNLSVLLSNEIITSIPRRELHSRPPDIIASLSREIE